MMYESYPPIRNLIMNKLLYSLLALALLLTSCEKDPGEGGTSSITGKVKVMDYNSDFTEIKEIYYGYNEDVYIIYGDEPVYGNSMKTSYDGTYRFDHLRKGKYKVFSYSKDSLQQAPGGIFAVIREVEITDKHQDLTLDDLVIVK